VLSQISAEPVLKDQLDLGEQFLEPELRAKMIGVYNAGKSRNAGKAESAGCEDYIIIISFPETGNIPDKPCLRLRHRL
jgi:hypothetical protein